MENQLIESNRYDVINNALMEIRYNKEEKEDVENKMRYTYVTLLMEPRILILEKEKKVSKLMENNLHF